MGKNEIEIKSPGIHSVLPLYVCMRRGVLLFILFLQYSLVINCLFFSFLFEGCRARVVAGVSNVVS